MEQLLLHAALVLIGPISGVIAHQLMNYVDDTKKWTDKLPDGVKQLLVVLMSAVIPAINSTFGVQLPDTLSQLLTEPVIQAGIASLLAFLLKNGQKQTHVTVLLQHPDRKAADTPTPAQLAAAPVVPTSQAGGQ